MDNEQLTIEFDLDDIAICVCRDGKSKGSQLAFYHTKAEAMKDENCKLRIECGTLAKCHLFFQLNYKMLDIILASLN